MASSFTNAQILAAVVTEWSRPAVSQIAVSKMATLPMMQTIQDSIIRTGLVGNGYQIQRDIQPFVANSVADILEPLLTSYFSRIPDESLPTIARTFIATAMEQPCFSILDGLVEFEKDDLEELKALIEKNLPLQKAEKYKIKK